MRPGVAQADSGPAADSVAGLSIVVPAYNEITRIDAGLGQLLEALERGDLPADTEVIVVDDGSTDGTAARARALLGASDRARVIEFGRNRGKGAAVRAGVADARG